MTLLTSALALALGFGGPEGTEVFPARSGESGLLDVPNAEVVEGARGMFGIDFRFDSASREPNRFGPLPVYAVAGIARRLEMGLTVREWGQPGDSHQVIFGGALKLQLNRPRLLMPGLAVDVVADRLNTDPTYSSRLIVSAAPSRFVRMAAFAGGELDAGLGFTYGAALSLSYGARAELVLEALGGPRGENLGGALRWHALPSMGIALGLNYLPREAGWRISLGFGFGPSPKRVIQPTATPVSEAEPAYEVEAPSVPAFLDDRPRFRLRVPVRGPALLADARHLQHGQPTPRATAAGSPGLPRPDSLAVRPAAPSLEDLAEAQVREQEALADARERRVRGTSEQLEAREKAAREEQKRLDESEQALVAREQQIDARARSLPSRAPPTQQVRQLESLEAQLASQERSLSAQERSYVPALDAAQGRERDAATREDAERREASRLAGSASTAPTRALQLEARKQAAAARNRQLAALEARLVARGEWVDSKERQLRTKAERLDAWSRRLDTHTERLDLVERIETPPKAPPIAPPPAPTGEAPAKDKAVFVMVVKSPTAIVKERPAAPAAEVPSSALHPGVAVEKAVAAATVLMFPTPASQISDLDRESLNGIARLAARERCEVLIWARAKDPALMSEAQRRAAEIRSLVTAAGELESSQVVTRITTRPGAVGVDVVVSALRETAKPAAAPAAAPPAAGLLSGESGRRQIREAVQTAQASIEACIGSLLEARKATRTEGVLKLTVSQRGQVTQVATGEGDISGTEVVECLNAAAKGWAFPAAEGEYVVDVPITVIRGGAPR